MTLATGVTAPCFEVLDHLLMDGTCRYLQKHLISIHFGSDGLSAHMNVAKSRLWRRADEGQSGRGKGVLHSIRGDGFSRGEHTLG